MIVYLDTSGASKILIREAESKKLRAYLDDIASRASSLIVSAALLETELRRMATRTRVAQRSVADALERIALIDMDSGIFREAGLLSGVGLRSLDALHSAVAERAAADEFITYDPKQAAAAESMGLRVVRPE